MHSPVTIEEFDKPYLAQVAVLALEQAGIQCFLENETIVSLDWFLTNAVGGIRLQVSQADAARAHEILQGIRQQRNEREAANKDNWVAFRCSRCKELVAFSGSSLGRVETCTKCGKYIDVPEESDASLSVEQISATIEHAKQDSFLFSGGFRSRTYLILEILLVLYVAYFWDLYSGISGYLEYFRNSVIAETQPMEVAWEDKSIWLWRRSLLVLAVMFPILLLNGFSSEKKPTHETKWARLVSTGTLLGLGTFVISWILWHWSWGSLVGEAPPEPLGLENEFAGWLIAMILVTIANSVAEELVMRAYLIDRIERLGGGTVIAVVASSLLFGSYHIYQGIIPGLFGATLSGLIFGVYYARYRRLFPLVLGHTIHNLLCVFLL